MRRAEEEDDFTPCKEIWTRQLFCQNNMSTINAHISGVIYSGVERGPEVVTGFGNHEAALYFQSDSRYFAGMIDVSRSHDL